MPLTPNFEAARAAFVTRVADAYLRTWTGYGYVGADYSPAAAFKVAREIADRDFPRPQASSGDGVSGE
jgi:hypothetical protein